MVGVNFKSTKGSLQNFVSDIFSGIRPKANFLWGWGFLKLLFWRQRGSERLFDFRGTRFGGIENLLFHLRESNFEPNFFFRKSENRTFHLHFVLPV